MIASQTSSPPHSTSATPTPFYADTPPPNRKRKHVPGSVLIHGSSPAPSDPGTTLQPTDNDVVAANIQASASRPRLTISRGPLFNPIAEDSEYCATDQIAINRLGFRYIPAGLSEPGSKIPYRTIESRPAGYVRVSWEDRSPFVKVTRDGLGLMGEKGFRSARCNVPVREGKWYMEVKIDLGGGERPSEGARTEGAHVRLGWGRREALLNGPVGLDGYSYGYRDKSGEKVTQSRPRPYGRPFSSGDVVGLYISLPPKRKPRSNDPHDPAHIRRERIAIEFKGQEYFESIEYAPSKEMIALMETSNKSKTTNSLPSSSKKSATVKNIPDRARNNKSAPEPAPMRPLPSLPGSHIAFFVNGECQGVAFQDLYDYLQLRSTPQSRRNQSKRKLRDGMREHKENPFDDGHLGYYPFISLFNGARVKLNAGPDFDFPPPPDIDGHLAGDSDSADTKTRTWRPLCERYAEFMAEQWELDAEEENDAKAESHPQPQPQQPQPQPGKVVNDEVEAKAAVRREKKRISEQKRRARKAEELKAVRAREKLFGADMSSPTSALGDRFGPAATGLIVEHFSDFVHSPAPTAGSGVDPDAFGQRSGWNSADEGERLTSVPHDQHMQKEEEEDEEMLLPDAI
ncbi:hypothetical protein BD410DRAFT_782697 [Rickenella mellea]|uniref:B30.2/SPRY domain-containing protein n=1 Tax=Rickenella mellea TaxID=50990 RepID=A0A4Y7QK18_9AGAM|nr:hypothetical protein BD410DRAFT_782697 [Rickenella mellea]